MILLDTHVLLWVMVEPGQISARAHDQIEQATRLGQTHVSAISAWEIAMLNARGRICLDQPVAQWLAVVMAQARIKDCPVTRDIAIDAGNLPGNIHGDPSDRLLIATARVLNLTLMTVDRAILAYGAQGHVLTQNARR